VVVLTSHKPSASVAAIARDASVAAIPRDAAAADGSAAVAVASNDAAEVAASPPADATAATTPPDAAESGTCLVEITSVPPGAQIARDDDTSLGTTPTSIELPCGVATKLVLRKQHYGAATKEITANAGAVTKVAVRLSKPQFTLRITSTPSGATISIGGKTAGVTPTVIRVAAFETTTVILTKDGYLPDLEKVTAKQNNAALHFGLKKKR